MKIADVMTRGVELVPATATVRDAAEKMAEYDVGAVLVGTEDDLQGILTDRDIILRVVVPGRDVTGVTVADVMSSSLYTCREDDSVETVFREMVEHQVRRLPVLDAAGVLAGIVALSDLGRHDRDAVRVSETLRDIAEPHRGRTADPD